MPPTTDDTQRRLTQLEESDRENTVSSATLRAQWALIGALALVGLGALGTGGSIVLQDRTRIDVLESKQRELERLGHETQSDQRALATTLAELRTDLRVIGSQITDVRDRAARIEAQLSQPAGFTPTRR